MKIQTALVSLVFLVTTAFGQEARVEIWGGIEWERMELSATVALDLASAGVRMPTGRSQAEEIIKVEYPSLIRPWILSIPIDSSTTLEDLINRGEFSFQGPELIAGGARRIPPALSTDLASLSSTYTIDLTAIGFQITRHSRPAEPRVPLIPAPAASYTGIIIIADGELPIHGRNSPALTEPCLFPKIWDTDMNLIYERNVLDPAVLQRTTMVRYVPESSIFQRTPSGLTAELTALVGANPLRIFARGVFGIKPTDPIIDREDALTILSSEDNRRLLREGKVAIVLNGQVLRSPFEGGSN
ncbi:hypothetical protein FACS189493_4510 [Spirochaetia bacterium]|nr:hypothetical protein FACS189493_4510 [Spirochaetia bacterium]